MLIVPTHTNPNTLTTLLERAGTPTIVIRTRPGLPTLGDHTLDDHGPVNIHRWWNHGIAHAVELGADIVVVANHDIIPADHHQIPRMIHVLRDSGATLGNAGLNKGRTGWCYALNLTHGLRAPEQYTWWYGDDWLNWRAAQLHGVIGIDVNIEHRRLDPHPHPPEFAHHIAKDRRTWLTERHAD